MLVRSFGKVNRDVHRLSRRRRCASIPYRSGWFPVRTVDDGPGCDRSLALTGGAYRAAGCKRRVAVSPVGAGPTMPCHPRRMDKGNLQLSAQRLVPCLCRTPRASEARSQTAEALRRRWGGARHRARAAGEVGMMISPRRMSAVWRKETSRRWIANVRATTLSHNVSAHSAIMWVPAISIFES